MTHAYKLGQNAWKNEQDPDEVFADYRRSIERTFTVGDQQVDDFWSGYADAREAEQAKDGVAA